MGVSGGSEIRLAAPFYRNDGEKPILKNRVPHRTNIMLRIVSSDKPTNKFWTQNKTANYTLKLAPFAVN